MLHDEYIYIYIYIYIYDKIEVNNYFVFNKKITCATIILFLTCMPPTPHSLVHLLQSPHSTTQSFGSQESQLMPVYPYSHLHVYPESVFWQVPCLQGLLTHASLTCSQRSPFVPCKHLQVNPNMWFLQRPPFLHGDSLHSFTSVYIRWNILNA